MKPTILVAALALLTSPTTAQHWTADEQSLLAAILHCWEQALTDTSMDGFREACRPTDRTAYWWTIETAPFHVDSPWLEGNRTNWDRTLLAQDLRPLIVQVDGEFRFAFFHGIRSWERDDGLRETESWKGYEVWKRTSRGWSFHSGMGTPDVINQIN